MNIADIPRRLGLVLVLQIAACVYCVLGVSAFVKINIMNEQVYYPPFALSLWMKRYGWLLFGLPLAWFWLSVRKWMRDGVDAAYLGKVVLSGVALLAVLFLLGLIGTTGTMQMRPLQGIVHE